MDCDNDTVDNTPDDILDSSEKYSTHLRRVYNHAQWEKYTLRVYIENVKSLSKEILEIEIEKHTVLYHILTTNLEAGFLYENLTELFEIDDNPQWYFSLWSILIKKTFDNERIIEDFSNFLNFFSMKIDEKNIKNKPNLLDVPLLPEIQLSVNRLFSLVFLHIAFSGEDSEKLKKKMQNKRDLLREKFNNEDIPNLLKVKLDSNLLRHIPLGYNNDSEDDIKDMEMIMRMFLEFIDTNPPINEIRYFDNSINSFDDEAEEVRTFSQQYPKSFAELGKTMQSLKNTIRALLPLDTQLSNHNVVSSKTRNLQKIPLFFH